MRVRMPADVERDDTILAGLTARQLLIIGIPLLAIGGAVSVLIDVVPLPALAAGAVPLAGAAVAAALVRRDGLTLDRLAAAALSFRQSPRHRATHPGPPPEVPSWVTAGTVSELPAPLELPVRAISDDGVIDLAEHGAALLMQCSTVNFALRTDAEQAALINGFSAFLNSLQGPVQVVMRAEAVRLDPLVAALDQAVPHLPHPALARAAADHADYLAALGERRDLLSRQVLLVLREPSGSGRQGAATLRRRAEDAARALAAAGTTATPLDGPAAAAVLAASADPTDTTAAPPDGLAPPEFTITGPGTTHEEEA
ncbi:PrgI family protein [Nocardiopsis coralliicola]